MKYKDYYTALGVPREADAEAIKKAYRKLAREFHPDVSKAADAEARFKEIGEAYATLKDPTKRAAYDELGRRGAGEDFTPPPQWQRAHAGGFEGFENIDLADILDALGRGSRHGSRADKPLHGEDYETTARIRLEDAHKGATVHLDLRGQHEDRVLEVTVPPGMRDGQRLRLKGRGGLGSNGGAAGDIYLHIEIAPHPVFRAEGHDLSFDLVLAPWEAVLGADIEVPTLDERVMLSVPAGTQSGRKLRLRGRGLANGHGGRGDLYAIVRITVPAAVTTRERDLYEQLARESKFDPRAVVSKEH